MVLLSFLLVLAAAVTLVIGLLKDGYVLSSETCAFDLIEADYVRDIEPGEIVVIEGRSIASQRGLRRNSRTSSVAP